MAYKQKHPYIMQTLYVLKHLVANLRVAPLFCRRCGVRIGKDGSAVCLDELSPFGQKEYEAVVEMMSNRKEGKHEH